MNVKKKIYPGFIYGFKYPVALVEFDNIKTNPTQLEKLDIILSDALVPKLDERLKKYPSTSDVIKSIADHILVLLDCGIVEKSQLKKVNELRTQILVPCHPISAQNIIAVLEGCISFLISDPSSINPATDINSFKTKLPALLRNPFKTSNSARFIKAAHRLNCLINVYESDFIDYGIGRCKTRMLSSFTETTSAIASALAKDKKLTSDLICQALLPGSQAINISSINQALIIAEKIGFPVVLKPRFLDGGVGVYPNLQNETQLNVAYKELKKITDKIIIEKYVPGRDFRLVSYRGRLIWAIERIYPGVSGDGIHSIIQLVDLENSNPLHNRINSNILKALNLDIEALECISKQGYSAESIPDSGVFIRLKDKSNVNVGGIPVTFALEKIHPDNVKLVNDVTKLIGLDLAGVDLIIENLSVSWKTSKALICEVNAQPTLGEVTSSHLYEEILKIEMSEGFSVPIALLPLPTSLQTLEKIAKLLNVSAQHLGVVRNGIAYLGDELLNQQPITFFKAALGLFQRKELNGAVLIPSMDIIQTGLPHFDIDFLLIPDEYLHITKEKQMEAHAIIFMALPYCKKILVSNYLKTKTTKLLDTIRRTSPKTLIEVISLP